MLAVWIPGGNSSIIVTTQGILWQTHHGDEVDLVLERGSTDSRWSSRVGHGSKTRAAAGICGQYGDLRRRTAWIIEQVYDLRRNIIRKHVGGRWA